MINRWTMIDDKLVGLFLGEVRVGSVDRVAGEIRWRLVINEFELLVEVEDIKFLRHEFLF